MTSKKGKKLNKLWHVQIMGCHTALRECKIKLQIKPHNATPAFHIGGTDARVALGPSSHLREKYSNPCWARCVLVQYYRKAIKLHFYQESYQCLCLFNE